MNMNMEPNALDFKNSHEIKNKNSNEIETPEPMVMNIPDTMNTINDIELHNDLNDVVIKTLMDKSDNEYSE